jgi:soluble lytic murein transglycosylase-like protein
LRARRRTWAAITDIFTGVPAAPPAERAPVGADPGVTYGARLGAHLLSRPGRLVVACLATVLGPAVVAQAGAIDARPAAEAAATADVSDGPVPVPVAGDRSTWLPVARRAAATCPGLSPAVLMAIAHVESDLGLRGATSPAGAVGPMQFLPSTWAAYGADGDGDGVSDAMNPLDAVQGAARLLCANGGADPDQLSSAVWNYNHSEVYVAQVMSLARVLPVSG